MNKNTRVCMIISQNSLHLNYHYFTLTLPEEMSYEDIKNVFTSIYEEEHVYSLTDYDNYSLIELLVKDICSKKCWQYADYLEKFIPNQSSPTGFGWIKPNEAAEIMNILPVEYSFEIYDRQDVC